MAKLPKTLIVHVSELDHRRAGEVAAHNRVTRQSLLRRCINAGYVALVRTGDLKEPPRRA